MDYAEVNNIFTLIVALVFFVFLTNILMKIANYIGEKLKIGDSFVNLFKKISKHK